MQYTVYMAQHNETRPRRFQMFKVCLVVMFNK